MTGAERRRTDQPPPLTVLVVDDSITVRALVRRALQVDGIRVVQAANGQEALTYAAIEHPDLILLDIDMPVMSGLEALDAMRRQNSLQDIPILMLTAHTEGGEVADALTRGAQDYLRKPWEDVELRARVRAALRVQGRQDLLRRRAEELGELSEHDPLTGLGNRRRLTQWLAERSDPARRLAAFMIDLDLFKSVNDTEGHAVGDRVLIQVAARLSVLVPGDDARLVVRWGGEEFLALAFDPPDGLLTEMGAAIVGLLRDEPIDVGGGRALAITASVGCAAGPSDQLSAILQTADDAMYQAKRTGRDRHVVAS